MKVDFNYDYNTLFYLAELITIIIIIISLYKIENDLNCNCSDNPMKKGLKGWFIFLIIYNILLNLIVIIVFTYFNFDHYYYLVFIYSILITKIIIFIITLVMFIRLFIYIKYLKNNCSCAYNSKEKYIYYYLIVYFSLILLMFFYSIISLIIITFK